jgi:hypothetical protein
MFVFFGAGDKIHIGEGVRHFMETDVAVGGLAGDALHEIIPGKIDAGLVDMTHKRTRIEPIVIVIPQDKDIVEVIELEFVQTEGQLYRGGADENGHFSRLLDFDIMEVLGMLKKIGAEEEFPLFFQAQACVVPEMTGHDGVIEGLGGDKTFELMPIVKLLAKQGYRAIEEQDSQYQ